MAPLHDDDDGRPTTTNAADEETETCEAMRDLVRGYKTFRAAHFSDDAGRGNGTTGTSSVKDTLRELSERGKSLPRSSSRGRLCRTRRKRDERREKAWTDGWGKF